MKIETILDQIDLGSMALPEFQRGYVWNREQVRGLMYSLYRKHPVGSLLVWVTKTEHANARGDQDLNPGTVKLLLDGQQRITSLYGLMRGKAPKFFDGNANSFTGLYFNLEDESFEFYLQTKMKDDPRWLSVTQLMQEGAGNTMQGLLKVPAFAQDLSKYLNRVNAIENIKNIDLHIEEVTGEDKTVDVVVDIFNRVNSGGTKLSKGDLTLAKICAEWPDARAEMKKRLKKWEKAGYRFKLDWLLRNINAVVTGESLFSAMRNMDTTTFKSGLEDTEKVVDRILNLIAGRLGLDHDRVLGSRFAIPLISAYFHRKGGKVADQSERDRLLFWYIHTILWGRYSGSTESVLSKDLDTLDAAFGRKSTSPIDDLIEDLRQQRANLSLQENDFRGSSRGNRFYPLLYMMTRVCHSRDFATGDELTNHLLGNLTRLEVHHLFPKALLYKHGYSKREVNAIANFTFLTQETNLEVSKRDPAEYLPAYEAKNPGVLKSHWIPTDPELWKIENYLEFLAERRKLLAESANEFLSKLHEGAMQQPQIEANHIEQAAAYIPGGIEDDDEEARLVRCNEWIEKQGLPTGELCFELIDPSTNELTAVLDLAWPDGVQLGLSQPVALLLGEGTDVEEAASEAGYRFFTSVRSFRRYVKSEILAHSPEAESGELEGVDA